MLMWSHHNFLENTILSLFFILKFFIYFFFFFPLFYLVEWAIIDQLQKPSPGFEDAIKKHFWLKTTHIKAMCAQWLEIAKTSPTTGHYDQMKRLVETVDKELEKLQTEFKGPAPTGSG
eukprot:TRINITY_DN6724_c0_g1_i4.p1 TRINITY_DN6724_c0_g1~~TRINITY_DN6724_c0_g1_i4.p1  ORF type:complete len:118 (-),score=6.06 TRINITY_DN6724_c0_g1_i4:134-487(-)